MKLNRFLKFLITVAAMTVIRWIGEAITAYIIGEKVVWHISYYCGLTTGIVDGIVAVFLAMWVVGVRFTKGESVHCQDCKHWVQNGDYCIHHDGMCASGKPARKNACNLWERRE